MKTRDKIKTQLKTNNSQAEPQVKLQAETNKTKIKTLLRTTESKAKTKEPQAES